MPPARRPRSKAPPRACGMSRISSSMSVCTVRPALEKMNCLCGSTLASSPEYTVGRPLSKPNDGWLPTAYDAITCPDSCARMLVMKPSTILVLKCVRCSPASSSAESLADDSGWNGTVAATGATTPHSPGASLARSTYTESMFCARTTRLVHASVSASVDAKSATAERRLMDTVGNCMTRARRRQSHHRNSGAAQQLHVSVDGLQ